MQGMFINAFMVAVLTLSGLAFLPLSGQNGPFEPAVHSVQPAPVVWSPTASVAAPAPHKVAKALVAPQTSPTEDPAQPQSGPIAPQIIYIVNTPMPTEPVNEPKKQEPVRIGDTVDGWPVYMGTGRYAVEPGTGSQWSVTKNKNGFIAHDVIWTPPK